MRYFLTILFYISAYTIFGQNGSHSYTTYTRPHFGVLVASTTLTGAAKASVARDTLSCEYIRSRIVCSQWNGKSAIYETNQAKHLKQGVVITAYAVGSQQPFVTNARAAGFKDTVQLIANKYFSPANVGAYDSVFVVANNEMQTIPYHSGSLLDWGNNELKPIYQIFHPLGIKVTDGGFITATGLKIKTWRYVNRTYGSTAAAVYALSLLHSQILAAQDSNSNPSFEALANQLDTIAMFKQYEDFVNMHYYEYLNNTTMPDSALSISPQILRYQKEYLEQLMGHPCVSNEFGIIGNVHPELMTSMMNNMEALGFQQSQVYDADVADPAEQLTNSVTGNILPLGTAYQTFVLPFTPQSGLP